MRMNLSKSEIIPMGTNANLDSLARELGCKVGALHSAYHLLGLPLGAFHNLEAIWAVLKKYLGKEWLFGRVYIQGR